MKFYFVKNQASEKLSIQWSELRKNHGTCSASGFMRRMPPGFSLLWHHLLLSGIMRTVHWLNAFTCKRQMLSNPFCYKNSQNKPFNLEQLVSCWQQIVGNSVFSYTLLLLILCVPHCRICWLTNWNDTLVVFEGVFFSLIWLFFSS